MLGSTSCTRREYDFSTATLMAEVSDRSQICWHIVLPISQSLHAPSLVFWENFHTNASRCAQNYIWTISHRGRKKGVFWKRGLFKSVHFLEILETLENLEILETPQNVDNKGESDHFLEILENFRDSRDSSSGKTPLVMTPFSVPDQRAINIWK